MNLLSNVHLGLSDPAITSNSRRATGGRPTGFPTRLQELERQQRTWNLCMNHNHNSTVNGCAQRC